ncbi:MAG: hypothetical protein M1822_007442, partial [Bathelium mastoideum]
GSGQIRLFSLLPGESSDATIIELFEEDLGVDAIKSHGIPKYTAISYTWGNPNDLENVLVVPNDARMQPGECKQVGSTATHLSVTRNAYEALLHLRLRNTKRTLWLDAICINQTDFDERSRKVCIMRWIYKLATEVIVWLGPEQDDSKFALEFMAERGARIHLDMDRGQIERRFDESDAANLWMVDEAVMAGRPDCPDLKPPLWPRSFDAIYTLLARPWFERLWIRQEVVLGNNVVIRAGATELSWDLFHRAVYGFGLKGVDGEKSEKAKRRRIYDQLCDLFSMLTGNPRFTRLLEKVSSCKCTDQRDKVYALIGLAQDRGHTIAAGVIPDYTKPLADVYRDICVRELDFQCPSLGFFGHCDMLPGICWRPTWVPNWSAPRRVLLGESHAHANSMAEAHVISHGLLRVTGIRVATVRKATAFPFKSENPLSQREVVEELRRLLPQQVPATCKARYGDRYYSALCDCLCSGRFKETTFPRSDYGTELCFLPQGLQARIETSNNNAFVDRFAKLLRENMDESEFERVFEFCVDNFLSMLGWAWLYGQDRSLVECEDGTIGLAPINTLAGDIFAVVLGCRQVLTFRPSPDGQYEVVGPAHVSGYSNDEALLGTLPEGYSSASVLGDDGSYRWSFRGSDSDEWSTLDPRIRWDDIKRVPKSPVYQACRMPSIFASMEFY